MFLPIYLFSPNFVYCTPNKPYRSSVRLVHIFNSDLFNKTQLRSAHFYVILCNFNNKKIKVNLNSNNFSVCVHATGGKSTKTTINGKHPFSKTSLNCFLSVPHSKTFPLFPLCFSVFYLVTTRCHWSHQQSTEKGHPSLFSGSARIIVGWSPRIGFVCSRHNRLQQSTTQRSTFHKQQPASFFCLQLSTVLRGFSLSHTQIVSDQPWFTRWVHSCLYNKSHTLLTLNT